MGVSYNVACKDCKKKRDLDKISIKPKIGHDLAATFPDYVKFTSKLKL